MAGVATSKRRQYSLDGHLPKYFPASFDKLCDPTGAQIVHATTGKTTVEGVVGPSPSTLFSAIGSLGAWVFFAAFIIMIAVAFEKDPPTINQMSLDVARDFEAPFPDLAVKMAWWESGRITCTRSCRAHQRCIAGCT